MKKEELDKLKAKYLAGNTSLEEERKLKELGSDEFFGMLQQPEEKMDWDFEDFMQELEEKPLTEKKFVPINRRIIALTSIAASLLLGIFIIHQLMDSKNPEVEPRIASTSVIDSVMDVERPASSPNESSSANSHQHLVTEEIVSNGFQIAAVKKSVKKQEKPAEVSNALDDEFYVEINGVRIYDEEKALEVTETALHLATTNLKKGMEGVEHIKYLKIEI